MLIFACNLDAKGSIRGYPPSTTLWNSKAGFGVYS